MKRVVVLVIVLLLCATGFADTDIDWTQYSDEDIESVIADITEMLNEARSELNKRNPSTAEGIGITTQKLLDDFASYREKIGLNGYSTYLLSTEKASDSILVQISDYCWIDIIQENGNVQKFDMYTYAEYNTEQVKAEIIADVLMSCTGLLALTNPLIEYNGALDVFNEIVQSGYKTVGDITYNFFKYDQTLYIFSAMPAK